MSVELAPVNVQPTRLAEIVFDRLSGAILDDTFAPGAVVRDNVIATQLGVSRMPVREALQRLQRIGLIDMAASRYTRVADVTPETVRDTLEFAACQAESVIRNVLPTLDLREARTLQSLVKDVIVDIDRGAPALASAHRICSRLSEMSRNVFLSTYLSDIDLAIQHNLRHADDSAPVREHVRARLIELADAVGRGDARAASAISNALHDLSDIPGETPAP